jgi:surfactin synthase thioesterase subunit
VGGTGESFRPLVPYLRSHDQVVIYNRRGFSRSTLDGPQDDAHRLTTDADDVRRLIEHRTSQPTLVFGSSSEALVALEVLSCSIEIGCIHGYTMNRCQQTRHSVTGHYLIADEPEILAILRAQRDRCCYR